MKLLSHETLLPVLFFRCIYAASCAVQSDVLITTYGSASAPGNNIYPYFLCNGQILVPGSMGQNQDTVLSAGECH